jgi:hypothetical protein
MVLAPLVIPEDSAEAVDEHAAYGRVRLRKRPSSEALASNNVGNEDDAAHWMKAAMERMAQHEAVAAQHEQLVRDLSQQVSALTQQLAHQQLAQHQQLDEVSKAAEADRAVDIGWGVAEDDVPHLENMYAFAVVAGAVPPRTVHGWLALLWAFTYCCRS